MMPNSRRQQGFLLLFMIYNAYAQSYFNASCYTNNCSRCTSSDSCVRTTSHLSKLYFSNSYVFCLNISCPSYYPVYYQPAPCPTNSSCSNTSCCILAQSHGENYAQYLCQSESTRFQDACQAYYPSQSSDSSQNQGATIGAVFAVLFIVVFVGCCCKSKSTSNSVQNQSYSQSYDELEQQRRRERQRQIQDLQSKAYWASIPSSHAPGVFG